MTRRLATCAIALLLTTLTGCGGGSSSMTAGSEAADSAVADAARPEAKPAAKAEAKGEGPAAITAPKIARSGSLTIRVDDPSAGVKSVRTTVAGLGGLVAAEEVTARDDNDGKEETTSAELVVQVPMDRLEVALDRLAALGVTVTRNVTSEDVTTSYVDLSARVATMKASLARTRVLLSKAEKISEIVAIESELTQREADLDSLSGQLQAMSARVAMASVTVTVLGPSGSIAKPSPSALDNGWRALVTSAAVLLAALAWSLPWLAVAALIGLPVWLWRRRAARGRSPVNVEVPAAPTGSEREVEPVG